MKTQLLQALTDRNVVITKHAIERFKQRFQRRFGKTGQGFRADSIILGQLKKSKECTQWKQSPFYVNKVSSVHGINNYIFKNGPVFYVCTKTHNKFIVLTVVEKWYCEPQWSSAK